MIASVAGKVTAIAPDGAVIEVGGVGILTHCTPGTLATLRIGEEARLATSLVVREESLTLFGFATDDERAVFELLQTASGVGPKLALAMLAVHTPNALRVAVAGADLKALTQVPGIGQKGAQRIVLELKDRLGTPETAVDAALNGERKAAAWREQVHSGLVGLGYSSKDADEAIAAVEPEADADLAAGRQPRVATLLKAALRSLSVR
ncbi:Holliday junction branch migration protein RuvA [Nonomuraea sp. B1E8]|uniref:Holliday junction branch migration protein RuvA n=1 Tax=unclassified Nonomuraea TaxID=2593643 RepID=UPI00325EFD82